MRWFPPPAESIRQRIPKTFRAALDGIEDYACYRLDLELAPGRPNQLGIILALWAKAGAMSGDLDPSIADADRIQRSYEKCVTALGDDAAVAFAIAAELAEAGRMFEGTAALYRHIGMALCR